MRRLAIPILAALAISLSACGGGSGSSAAPVATGLGAARLIAASADKATQDETAKVAGSITADAAGRHQTIAIDGGLNFASGDLQFSMDLGELGLPGSSGGTIEARVVDGVIYMKLGDLGGANGLSKLLDGKEWLKLDPSALPGGAGGSGLGSLSDSNLRGTLDALRGVGDVQLVGTETLRGDETTHYRAEIDPAKAIAEAPAGVRDKVKSALGATGGRIPVDVWIDGNGRARKIATDIDTAEAKVSTSIEYFDFGADVNVSAPPADQVLDFSEFYKSLGRMPGSGIPTV